MLKKHTNIIAQAVPHILAMMVDLQDDEDWVNANAMWMNYLASRDLFDYMGIPDHLAVCLHETGHMVTERDLEYLLDFADYHLYGKERSESLDALDACLFETEQYDFI